jgi:hypothetical protein
MWQICGVARYYITFEAKEKDQAVVDQPPPIGGGISVLSFRECEQEQGKGKGINYIERKINLIN